MADYYVDIAAGNDSNAGTSPGSGNAWATLGKAASVVHYGDRVLVKASGEYDLTAGVSWDSGGSVPSSAPLLLVGYGTTINDGVKPVVKATASISGAMFTSANANTRYANFTLNGNGLAATGLTTQWRGGMASDIEVTACTAYGIQPGEAQGLMTRCRVWAMASGATSAFDLYNAGGFITDSVAHDNPCPGFNMRGNAVGAILNRVVSTRNTVGAYLSAALSGTAVLNSTFYNNSSHGVQASGYEALAVRDSIIVKSGGYGLIGSITYAVMPFADHNAYWSNFSGNYSGFAAGPNDFTTLSGNPFTSPDASITSLASAFANFTLNGTAGAVLKAAGFGAPNLDIGASQSTGSGGGSSGGVSRARVMGGM